MEAKDSAWPGIAIFAKERYTNSDELQQPYDDVHVYAFQLMPDTSAVALIEPLRIE